jgi:hypothetical protein
MLAAGLASFSLISLTASVVTGTAASAASGPAAAAPAPAVPASDSFVAQPQVSRGVPDVRQACSTPTTPGQMACMALVSTLAHASSPAKAGPDAGPPSDASYEPSQLQNAYGLAAAAALAGDDETVAVVDAFNDPSAGADLDAYRTSFGLGDCDQSDGCLTVVNQAGGRTPLPKSDPTGGWELEETLDLDMVSAVCPKCSILLVEADSASISDLAIAERTASRSNAEAVSNSWGSGAEFTGENAYDADFYAPGVAITAAGGDDGYGTQYPAVSPYVTAVGGTTLSGSTGDWTQTAWNGTGSGCSELEPKPSWQTSDNTSPDGCLNRTDDDLAAVANPDPGVWIYDTVKDVSTPGLSGWMAVGGTSVSTPIVAAAYALADIAGGGPGSALIPQTFPAAYPYQNSADFTQVTSGSNGSCESGRRYLCQARAGYNGPAGVGVPVGTSGLTGPPGGEVTVMDPGTQVYQVSQSVRLALNVQPGSSSPAFTTSGLPAGMAIAADGVVTGKAPATAGIREVTVTAAASGLPSGSAKFAMVIVAKIKASHPATGEVKLNGGAQCLSGAHDSSAPGTAVQVGRCSGESAQQWKFVPNGSVAGVGHLELHGRCLAILGGSADGAKAALAGCTSSARQLWTYGGAEHLRNSGTGSCLAIKGKATSGARAEVWSCSGGASIAWALPAAPVLSALAGRCLSDPGSSSTAGTRIELASCSSSGSQRWTAEHNNTIEIAGKCLDVKGSSMLDGAAIVLAKCSSAAAEHWERGPDGQLINASSGRCLAGPDNSRTAGTKLIQDDCYSEPGEIWVIS